MISQITINLSQKIYHFRQKQDGTQKRHKIRIKKKQPEQKNRNLTVFLKINRFYEV